MILLVFRRPHFLPKEPAMESSGKLEKDKWLTDFAQLFASALGGDETAAKVFVERHGMIFRLLIRKSLSNRIRGVMDSEDVLQEFFLTTLGKKSARTLALPPGALLAYLREAAHNLALDMNRKHLDAQCRTVSREKHFSEMPAKWRPEDEQSQSVAGPTGASS
jgi:DNA-directed RNA polymerase specialized sigma24 family protein